MGQSWTHNLDHFSLTLAFLIVQFWVLNTSRKSKWTPTNPVCPHWGGYLRPPGHAGGTRALSTKAETMFT